MELKNLVQDYLEKAKLMHVATSSGIQPWAFTVYYAADKSYNPYWISTTDTRHSKEISKNKHVAATIPVKFDDLIVVGLQCEGAAAIIEEPAEIKQAIRLYTTKHNRGEDWYNDFVAGKNKHKLYRIKPRLFVLFDRLNFPDNPRQELELG